MDILAKLFMNETRVKLMRLFLFNQDAFFTLAEITERSKSRTSEVKKELALLISIGLLKKRPVTREIQIKRGKKSLIKVLTKKVHDMGFGLEQKFPYLQALKSLLITASLHADEALIKRLGGAGKIKFFAVSGLFIQEWDARVDMLIVGDSLNLKKLDRTMKDIEAEVGREIAYSAFETVDFEYRYGIYDRLIRDIIDMPHVTLVDKLGIEKVV